MKAESVAVDSLVLDPSNARKHSPKNLEAIKGSLAKFGQQKPIVVGKGNVVIAGNGTLEAARSLGWDKIAVVRTSLEGTDATAFAIADNRTGELAEWDSGVLSDTLKSLNDLDFDLESIGFSQDDLDKMIATPVQEGLTDPDEIPEQVETRCKPGDLWILGNHRLLCGDSTNVQHVERLMGGEKADMVFTDPPYGMNLDTAYAKPGQKATVHGTFTAKRKNYAPVIGDDAEYDAGVLLGLFQDVPEIFLFGADYYSQTIPNETRLAGSWFVWDKRCGESADKVQGSAFELCWSKKRHKREILRIRSGIYGAKDDSKSRVHPTQKLVQVPQWFIDQFSEPADLVADLFLGSGSTLIACEKTGRRCFGMEIDPKYADVILTRWEQFTGKTATLETRQKADG